MGRPWPTGWDFPLCWVGQEDGRHFRKWHQPDLPGRLLFGRFQEQSGHPPATAEQSRFMSTRPRFIALPGAWQMHAVVMSVTPVAGLPIYLSFSTDLVVTAVTGG